MIAQAPTPERPYTRRSHAAYTQLLHAHIRREENDCFGPADRELPADAQAALVEGYERIEREVMGEGRHEAFHALLDRLSQVCPG